MAGGNKLRVLCLHGYGQDGDQFRAKSGSCRKDSKKVCDFEFVTSPQRIAPGKGPGAGHPDHKDDGKDPGRFWWDFTTEDDQMRGMDESIRFVASVFEEQGPFDGILAFSQGAGFVAILMAMLQRGELAHLPAISFKFGVLASGFHPRDPAYKAKLQTQPLTMPSLHIYGDTDGIIEPERSRELIAAWEPATATVLTHDGGHLMPSAATVRKGLKAFLQVQLEAGGGQAPSEERQKPVHKKQQQKQPKEAAAPAAAAAAAAPAPAPVAAAAAGGAQPWRVSLTRSGSTTAPWSVRLVRTVAAAWPELTAENIPEPELRAALLAGQKRLALLTSRVDQLESTPGSPPAPVPAKAKAAGKPKAEKAPVELGFRCVVYRCDSCSLLIDNKDEWTHIGAGFVIGLCFLKGASLHAGTVAKAVATILSMPIGEKGAFGSAIILLHSPSLREQFGPISLQQHC